MSTAVDISFGMKPKRRTAEDSKTAILAAARQLFAAKGYDRTTIRDIAAAAGCDPAMVIRYFTSKRDLFIEAVDLALESFPDAPQGELGDLVAVAERLLDKWHADPTFMGLLRSAGSDEEAAELMREFFERRVRKHQSRVFGLPPDLSVCFGAMMIGVAMAREVCKIPPISTRSSRELAEMIGAIVNRGATSSSH
jgi:AcrR family transcriptional regulator